MAERALPVYAFDRWTVKPGNEAAFVAAWTALIDWTLDTVPGLVGRQGQLLQDVERPSDFVCPLAWESMAALEAWRALPTFSEHMAVLRELSDDRQLRTLEVVHRLDESQPGPATNVFTVDHWTLRPGRDRAFMATWTAFITWTVRDVPGVAPAMQRLFRDVHAPAQVFCPLAWESIAAVEAWQGLPAFGAHRAALRRAGEEQSLQTLEVVTCRDIGE